MAWVGQVSSRFLNHVLGDEQFVSTRGCRTPQGFKPRAPVGGREQNVGVQEDPQVSRSTRTPVRDALGVETQGLDLLDCPGIPSSVNCVGEQEFCFSFWCVHLYGHRDRGPDENSVGLRFGDHERSFAYAVSAAKLRGDHHGATLSCPYGPHMEQTIRFSYFQQEAFGHIERLWRGVR